MQIKQALVIVVKIATVKTMKIALLCSVMFCLCTLVSTVPSPRTQAVLHSIDVSKRTREEGAFDGNSFLFQLLEARYGHKFSLCTKMRLFDWWLKFEHHSRTAKPGQLRLGM